MTINKQASKSTDVKVEEAIAAQVGQVEIPAARLAALRLAIQSLEADPRAGTLHDFAGEVVGRAEKFHAFLTGSATVDPAESEPVE